MELDLIVEGGTVVAGNDTYRADVGVAGGKVVALGVGLGTAPRIVRAARRYALTGAIDVHTHFEMPFMGTYTADDFRTGTAAAAGGGITTVVDWAIQEPGDRAGHCARGDRAMSPADGAPLGEGGVPEGARRGTAACRFTPRPVRTICRCNTRSWSDPTSRARDRS